MIPLWEVDVVVYESVECNACELNPLLRYNHSSCTLGNGSRMECT